MARYEPDPNGGITRCHPHTPDTQQLPTPTKRKPRAAKKVQTPDAIQPPDA